MLLKDFIQQYRITRNIKRFSMETVTRPQDLAGHGYSVGSLFYLLCLEKGFEPFPREIFLAMNHDFAETYTGDLNKRVKDKDSATIVAWDTIELHTLPARILNYTDKHLQDLFSPEAYRLFLLADALDALLYCSEEVQGGNQHMIDAYDHYTNSIRKFVETELSRQDNSADWIDTLNSLKGIE